METSLMVNVISIFASYPVKRAALFGSRSRGDEDSNSDFDYIIEFEQEVTSTQFYDLWDALEDVLGTSVDILTPSTLLQLPKKIKSEIENEVRRIYER